MGGRRGRKEESLRKQKKKKKKKRPRREILSCNLVPRFSPRSLSLSLSDSLYPSDCDVVLMKQCRPFMRRQRGTAMTHNVSLVRPRELYVLAAGNAASSSPVQPVRDCTSYFCLAPLVVGTQKLYDRFSTSSLMTSLFYRRF